MKTQPEVGDLVLGRMKELADGRTAWHRALWQPGTIVLLDEVTEAVRATWDGSLASDDAMKDVITVTRAQVKRDPGVGDPSVRDRLDELLASLLPAGNTKAKPTADLQQALERVVAFTDRCRTGYFLRWVDRARAKSIAAEEVELAARLLISHLLDEGFHRNHIHGWLHAVKPRTALDKVLSKGREMLLEAPREFDFLVGVTRAPAEVVEAFEPNWVSSDAFIERFRDAANPQSRPVPREGAGAVTWSTQARDPHQAMNELLEWQQRLLARVRLGYGQPEKVEFEPDVIDVGANRLRTAPGDRRSIRVPAFQRNRLFASSADSAQQLDGAIGLLAAQSGEARGASIASVWAAAEGLLGRPGGKGVDVADRLADIVACSFPRAEIGELARNWHEHGSGPLRDALQDASSTEQAEAMAKHIERSGDPGFQTAADQAAVARYVQLASDPVAVLSRVRGYYSSVFRRLYYQRNFIMHAAKFDSVTLGVSARTAPLLVAAALDRLVNAQYGHEGLTPHGLAARAQNELDLVGKSGSRPLYMLLD